MGYIYILGTIFFTVYGQLAIKYGVTCKGAIPLGLINKIIYFSQLLMNPFILTGLISAFVASLFWMATLTKFELSFAYPFMSLSFILVFALSIILFKETVTISKIAGLILIILGIFIMSRSLS